MRKSFIIIIFFLILSDHLQAQNKVKLDSIKLAQTVKNALRIARINEYLEANRSIAPINLGQHEVIYDITQDGRIITKKLFNEQARQTTNVDSLSTQRLAEFNLDGSGMTVGVWDGGNVLNSHVEFQNRISNLAGADLSDHATHVTGTIAASGVNPRARGMAPMANVKAFYGFENDLATMADQASMGMLISNHSYGLVVGWQWDGDKWVWRGEAENEDYRFGFYSGSEARVIDNIAFNAPHYLVVWAAGNDRSDSGDGTRPPDGPFDTVTPEGTAKNILTVGAIQGFASYNSPEDAKMSTFSSWGPTDDGRIKPDLVGDGVGVYSTSSSGVNEYSSKQGTSMATPNVTGSLILLQQLYNEIHNNFMRSATLKGIAIHTTKEAGPNEGPDYQFGWGVMDAYRAALVINESNNEDSVIYEGTLNEGEVYERYLFSDGKTPITATLSWTDLPGTSPAKTIDPQQLILVNDLNIRIVDAVGDEILPWILDPSKPSAKAIKGVNYRDNVERINFTHPEPRIYKIQVSHSGELVNEQQDFSLIITGETSKATLANNFYWINGEGEWNNQENWALDSGGESQIVVPGEGDHVIIDGNSTGNSDTISVSSDLNINNLTVLDNNSVTIDLQGNTLAITGEINFLNRNANVINGTLKFINTSEGRRRINLSGNNFKNLYFVTEGEFLIENEIINATGIDISEGSVLINNSTSNFSHISLRDHAILEVKDNQFNGLSNLLIEDAGDLVSQRNNFIIENDLVITSSSIMFNDNFIISGANLVLKGSGSLDSIAVNSGNIQVIGSFTIFDALLNNGGALYISSSGNLTIEDNFILDSKADNRIIISSLDENPSVLQLLKRKKYCLDYVDINNVIIQGDAAINLGENSSRVGNTSGITSISCEDVLFANFKLENQCANSLIYFTDISSGSEVEYQWDFNNEIPVSDINSNNNPYTYFSEPGIYEITLTVSNSTGTNSYTKEVEIVSNTIAPIEVKDVAAGLVSGATANSYLWLIDGEIVPESNRRIFGAPIVSGSYQVVNFYDNDQSCGNRISFPYEVVVTSVKDNSPTEEEVRKLNVFPNPFDTHLNIEGEDIKGSTIIIYNATGSIVHQEEIDPSNVSHVMNLRNLKKGLYIIWVNNSDFSKSLKVIKTN